MDNAVSNCPSAQLSIRWTVLCPTVYWMDSALSNCPLDGQCSTQMSIGGTVLCPTVYWMGQCSVQLSIGWTVQLSIGWTVLCPTVHRMDSPLSNCPLDGQCSAQLSIGWTLLCPTFHFQLRKGSERSKNKSYCVLSKNENLRTFDGQIQLGKTRITDSFKTFLTLKITVPINN